MPRFRIEHEKNNWGLNFAIDTMITGKYGAMIVFTVTTDTTNYCGSIRTQWVKLYEIDAFNLWRKPLSHEHGSKWTSERANERSGTSSVKQANEWAMGANERADEQIAQYSILMFHPLFSIQQIQKKLISFPSQWDGEICSLEATMFRWDNAFHFFSKSIPSRSCSINFSLTFFMFQLNAKQRH